MRDVTVRLVELGDGDGERTALVKFLTSEVFPFHVNARASTEQVERWWAEGRFRGAGSATFWIHTDDEGPLGIVTLDDLDDLDGGSPLFDLRLAECHRGRGLGATILRAVTDHVFRTYPDVNRFEGTTREDNLAMRATFRRAGWVKEAHYREAWPVPDGPPVASIGYAMLRHDWRDATTTPVDWFESPTDR